MKLITVQPPHVDWIITANWDGEDAWYKFEYIHDDGTTELIQWDDISYCCIPQSDDFVKIRVTVLDGNYEETSDVLATEDILIRPR